MAMSATRAALLLGYKYYIRMRRNASEGTYALHASVEIFLKFLLKPAEYD